MIKSTDLRIGNWVEKHNYGTTGNTIQKIDGAYISWVENGSSKCFGIPITPELLLKCGFTKAPETDPYGFYLSPEFQDCKIRVRQDEFGWHWQYGSATIRLPHLHQLQNLYYCLTGSELEINL